MLEQLMFFAIGFLVAALFNLFLVPLVHNRAVRLTMRRMEASTPYSMAEIQAEKDQLRAEFAMSTRRLEISVEQLKAKTTAQLGELGKKAMAIDKLRRELTEKNEQLAVVETRETGTLDQLQSTEQSAADRQAQIGDLRKTLAAKDQEIAKVTAAFNERAMTTDSQRVEIATLKTQIEQLQARLSSAGKDATLAPVAVAAASAAASSTDGAEQRAQSAARIAQLEQQLAKQTKEAEVLSRRVQELESRLTEQGQVLVEREYEARQRTASAEQLEKLTAERARLQQERDQAREENARLKRETATLLQGNEAAWATERVESALLRERINDIAAEVTRLTLALEGPGSPIEALLAADSRAAGGGANGTTAPNGEAAPHGDLVDRIRSLQARVSRAAPPA